MTKGLESLFKAKFPEIERKKPLKSYNSYKIGGEADLFYELKDLDLLPGLIKICKENNISYFILGSGTNILFSDQGFKGLVIKMSAEDAIIDENKLICHAGLPIPKLLKCMMDNELTGVEADLGLPGTVGGAVRGNAARLNTYLSDFLLKVDVFDTDLEEMREFSKDDLYFGYRDSTFKQNPNLIILKAYFSFPKASSEEIKKKQITAIKEGKKYPSQPNCGSFFKNPDASTPSGMLIDKCKLKGYQVGEIQVSDHHANFLVNLGDGKAEDVLKLASHIKKEVKTHFDIDLEEEVKILPYDLNENA